MAGRRQSLVLTGPAGLALAEGSLGAALLLWTRPLMQSLAREPVDRQAINVARILAVRYVLQGFVTARRPTRRVLELGVVVEALHAATMIAGTAAHVGPRRLTVASATAAGAFTAAGLAQSRRR
jgi:hypothetical protein